MLVLYIHGFLSSPLSQKAQQTSQFCHHQTPSIPFACPALSAYPNQAISVLTDIVEKNVNNKVGLIGSSLGGYYATNLAEKFRIPAVVVNPAVRPYDLMANYLGQDLKNYHTDEISQLRNEHVQQLRDLEVDSLQCSQNIWLMAQTGDETLDYTQAVNRYQSCKMTIEEGGDHSFQHFDRWLPEILTFLTRD